MVFKDRTAAVGLQEPYQVIDLGLDLPPGVSLCDLHAMLQIFKDCIGGRDVEILPYRFLFAGKWFVGNDTIVAGVKNEGVPRNAAGVLAEDEEVDGIIFSCRPLH